MCRFRVNGSPIRHIFHRFQNLPASCERSLRLKKRQDVDIDNSENLLKRTCHFCNELKYLLYIYMVVLVYEVEKKVHVFGGLWNKKSLANIQNLNFNLSVKGSLRYEEFAVRNQSSF